MDAICFVTSVYRPEEYYMYRVYDKSRPADGGRKEENLRAWQELTSPDIPLSDIESVVYGYSLEQMRNLSSEKRSGNAFARCVVEKGDSEIIDFMMLAKTCEDARAMMSLMRYFAIDSLWTKSAVNAIVWWTT